MIKFGIFSFVNKMQNMYVCLGEASGAVCRQLKRPSNIMSLKLYPSSHTYSASLKLPALIHFHLILDFICKHKRVIAIILFGKVQKADTKWLTTCSDRPLCDASCLVRFLVPNYSLPTCFLYLTIELMLDLSLLDSSTTWFADFLFLVAARSFLL